MRRIAKLIKEANKLAKLKWQKVFPAKERSIRDWEQIMRDGKDITIKNRMTSRDGRFGRNSKFPKGKLKD